MRITRPSIAIAAAVTLGLAGCSGGSTSTDAGAPATSKSTSAKLSTEQIVERLHKYTEQATSVRITGRVPVPGGGLVDAEFAGLKDGTKQSVTAKGDAIGSFQQIVVGDAAYIKGDEAYWKNAKVPASRYNALLGKWVKVPASQATHKYLKVGSYLDLFSKMKPSDFPQVTREKLDGANVLKMSSPSGNSASTTGTLWVSDDDKAVPVKIEVHRGGQTLNLKFSDWNKSFDDIKEPPASEVVSAS